MAQTERMSTHSPSSPTSTPRFSGSAPRGEPTQNDSDTPTRSQSMGSKGGPTSQQLPFRSNSVQQGGHRPPSSSRPAQLVNVARRDFEQHNLGRTSTSSRRSSSADRHVADRHAAIPDTPRSAHRTSSRSTQPRHEPEVSNSGSPQPNGISSEQATRSSQNASDGQRRRTMVTAQTGNWALGKTIGAGSMGKVKLARNTETGEQVAIKIVPRFSQDDHRSQQDRERADHSKEVRTAREASIVTLVNHPYICGMRDVVRTRYHWYMLFEYVNGGQMLDYIISHGRLKEKQARKFARQIASALDYCHRNSIVHRDLKIENILISKTGDIKIIDFGLSNLFSPRSQLKTFCGSLYFAAPELLQAKQYQGPEVDIWSFGIVLYVLVCGKVPFDDQSMPQLHAKIKRGAVEYPPWLSSECKHIISRMLVTDPSKRAPLSEIMSHPWLTKGLNGPPDNFLPLREPLQLPLDSRVIEKMTGFEFGSADFIRRSLEGMVESSDYQRAVKQASQRPSAQPAESDRKRGGMFDFYQRRKSASSREVLATPSSDTLHLGDDPVNAYAPLISIYYLAREKLEREKSESNPGGLSIPQSPGTKPLQLPDLPAPEAAVTNSSSYEMAGEAPTGGRTRPRARTQGEDEINEKMGPPKIQEPSEAGTHPPRLRTPPAKKGNAAAGLLRRISTRKRRDSDHEKVKSPPSLNISGPEDQGVGGPGRQSFTVKKTRERDTPPSSYKGVSVSENHPDRLAPPARSEGPSRKFKGLGRSTSVNSADLSRRLSKKRAVTEGLGIKPAGGTESERSSISDHKPKTAETVSDQEDAQTQSRTGALRTKSMGHDRRNSFQARRTRPSRLKEEDVPEETDQELAEEYSKKPQAIESQEALKPVYLKGLFSVSTTSNKPLSFIRSDIIRVLKQLGVGYEEMKGGFSCRHVPSIDINKVVDNPPSDQQPKQSLQTHRRKISFAGLRNSEKDRDEHGEQHHRSLGTPRSSQRRAAPDGSYTNSDDSDDENAMRRPQKSPRAAGETTTHVQSDLGQSMILKFEILVVKVPFLSLHGLQFKKVDGGTWQYKRMAETILNELSL